MKCVNCGGEHMSTSRICDHWRKEKEIVTVKHKESLSFPEARKIVESRHSLPSSFSTVLKTNKKVELKDANTQTTETANKEAIKEIVPNTPKPPTRRNSA